MYVFGASLSKPHIDEFAMEFLYIYIIMYIYIVCRAVSHFQLLFCAFFLYHALIQNNSSRMVEDTKNSHKDEWTAR